MGRIHRLAGAIGVALLLLLPGCREADADRPEESSATPPAAAATTTEGTLPDISTEPDAGATQPAESAAGAEAPAMAPAVPAPKQEVDTTMPEQETDTTAPAIREWAPSVKP